MESHPIIRWTTLTIDCAVHDVDAVAAFYGRLLGWEVTASDGEAWRQLRDPSGGVGLNVQGEASYQPPVWPEVTGGQQKMSHLEVMVDDLTGALAVALAAGGREAPWQPPDRDRSRLRVVLDPAGHPCCLFVDGE